MPTNYNRFPHKVLSVTFIGALFLTSCTSEGGIDISSPTASASTSEAPSPAPAPAQPSVTQVPGAHCHIRGELPDPVCTPGALNPDVTQDTIHATICVAGYTNKIRPSTSFTNNLKLQQMQEYGLTLDPGDVEEDHLIPLSLGGAPKDPLNLWPEPDDAPNPKDRVERHLLTAVCAQPPEISLAEAQHRIASDWTTADQGIG
jgi:hypothetical protein